MRYPLLAGLLPAALVACAAAAAEAPGLGASSCASSGCHGGGERHEFITWSRQDVHARSAASLATARAARMGEALGIADPATSPRCTICHAPLALAPAGSLGSGVSAQEGVSCASCHGVPDAWIRSHTRPDWTHADRVAAGMRDLSDLYGRANSCVACHQAIDPQIVRTGRHPALLFEMDGQTQDEPPHWKDSRSIGARAWYVGQAVALRETSWALLNARAPEDEDIAGWKALAWLLGRSAGPGSGLPQISAETKTASYSQQLERGDTLARMAARSWEPGWGDAMLRRLAGTGADFLDPSVSRLEEACRAERLVLALDRLVDAEEPRPPARASACLDRLFKLAQSKPDFSPEDFAGELNLLSAALRPVSASTRG